MSGACCRTDAPRPSGLLGWAVRLLPCLVPGSILAIAPKCPACFAGYFALATGMGIPVASVPHVQLGLMALFAVSLVWLVGTRVLAPKTGDKRS